MIKFGIMTKINDKLKVVCRVIGAKIEDAHIFDNWSPWTVMVEVVIVDDIYRCLFDKETGTLESIELHPEDFDRRKVIFSRKD